MPENQEDLPLNSTFYFNRNVELKWCASVHGEQILREALCAYYSLISLIDNECGRILDCLDELGIRDDTIVIFCSDHGDFAGEYGRMAKGWHYDCTHRVPLIWNWKGGVRSGRTFEGFAEAPCSGHRPPAAAAAVSKTRPDRRPGLPSSRLESTISSILPYSP